MRNVYKTYLESREELGDSLLLGAVRATIEKFSARFWQPDSQRTDNHLYIYFLGNDYPRLRIGLPD